MKRYYCDICRKEIKPSDIHVKLDIRVSDKFETLDLHSTCHYMLLKTIKQMLEDLNENEIYTVNAENI